MKFLPLVWAGLWRKRVRTVLAMLSVAIARALVSDPSMLVCDEPTGDLDRETSDAILGLLQLLNRTHGKTIVMVTHDPRAADHASRRLYVDKGVLGLAPLGNAA